MIFPPLFQSYFKTRAFGILLWMLLCLAAVLPPLHAQDSESDNPDGPSGSYSAEVRTGGQYDPYTCNAKRTVTDLVVPNSSLAFTRYFNSRLSVVANDRSILGDGSNWRHSYQWALAIAETTAGPGSGPPYPTAYNVAYPDGSVVTFRSYRAHSPENNVSYYWHGPVGIQDRLYVSGYDKHADVILLLSDGSQVYFGGGSAQPQYMLDPHKAVTTFTYTPGSGYLSQVTEPGGRWIQLFYQTYTIGATSWILLNSVTASTGQSVNYSYAQCGSHTVAGAANPKPYYVLSGAAYASEPSTAGNGTVVAAQYTYQTNGSVLPDLASAIDPHDAGAMVNIRYVYSGPGYVEQEQNFTTSETVSKLIRSNNGSTCTETRGDHAAGGAAINRVFNYGPTSFTAADGSTVTATAKAAQPTSVTDFEGNASHLSYNGGYLQDVYDAKGVKTSYQHEPLTGKVTSVTLPDSSVRTYVWQGRDGGTSNVYSDGSANVSYPYYLSQVTDERGQSITYYRDSTTGLVNEIDYPDGGKEIFHYQPFNVNGHTFYKASFHQDQRGAKITYGYDEANHGGSGFAGLLTSVTRNYTSPGSTAVVSETTTFVYDGLDRLQKTTDPRGISESFTYNARHQLLSVTHQDNHSISYAYDDYGNRYGATDELGHTTTTAYDEYRRVTSVKAPVNAPQADGTQITNRIVRYAYDRRDNSNNPIATATSHTAANWSLSWTASGRASQRIFSPNNWATDEYDGMSVSGGANPAAPQPGPGFVHTTVAYNAIGQPVTGIDAQNFSTAYGYDAYNRLATVTDPDGHSTTRNYYANNAMSIAATNPQNCTGLLRSIVSPGTDAGSVPTVKTQYTNYDQMARLTETVEPYFADPSNPPYIHTYDSTFNQAGDLTSQTDGAHSTGYRYDQLGRKSQLVYPDNTREKWTYDASGNVLTYTNRAGAYCTYDYTDGRNRCNGYHWTGTGAALPVAYVYDAAGRVTEVANNAADLQFTYDDSNQLTSETERPGNLSSGKTTSYTHDKDGNVDSITYPVGTKPCYTYDNQERCTGMYVNGNLTLSHYNYYGNWLAGRWLYPGIYTQYDYQRNGRITDVYTHYGDNSGNTYYGNISLRTYGYAPDGQASWAAREAVGAPTSLENGRGDAYYYLPDGSLQTVCRNVAVNGGWPGEYHPTADSVVNPQNLVFAGGNADTYSGSYAYDTAGNRTYAAQLNQPPVSYSDNSLRPGQNQYSTSTYDANGNTLSAGGGWTYQYDSENHLLSASNGTTGQYVGFSYDPLGRVIQQSANGGDVLFYYAGSQRIEERDLGGDPHFQYYFEAPGSDRLLYRQNLNDGSATGVLWCLSDALGNTTHLCDGNGSVVEAYLYDAYGTPSVYDAAGNLRSGGSLYDNRYQWKSGGAYEWLAQAGLYYCRARFYTPQQGRWLQPDPIGQAGGLNIYTYCGNDPVDGIDPNGLTLIWDGTTTAEQVIVEGGGPMSDLELMQAGQTLHDLAGGGFSLRSTLNQDQGTLAFGRGHSTQSSNGTDALAQLGGPEWQATFGFYTRVSELHAAAVAAITFAPAVASQVITAARVVVTATAAAIAGDPQKLEEVATIGEAETPTAERVIVEGNAAEGAIPTLEGGAGSKISQQFARWLEAGGKGGWQDFLQDATNLANRAQAAGTSVTGTVGQLTNATIYREGSTYMVVQGGRIMSYVPNASAGGIVDVYTALGGL